MRRHNTSQLKCIDLLDLQLWMSGELRHETFFQDVQIFFDVVAQCKIQLFIWIDHRHHRVGEMIDGFLDLFATDLFVRTDESVFDDEDRLDVEDRANEIAGFADAPSLLQIVKGIEQKQDACLFDDRAPLLRPSWHPDGFG